MSVFESGNPLYNSAQFWIDLLEIQLLELRVDLKNNDFNHAVKEACDLISVAQDMLRIFFGKDSVHEGAKRLVENLEKWANKDRGTMQYQEDKKRKLLEELGEGP